MRQFGGKLTQPLKERYAQSANWKEGKFENLTLTTMDVNLHTLPKILYKQFCEREGRLPAQPLPVARFDAAAFLAPSREPQFIWYGHSVVLVRMAGKTMLIDPMLGHNASPIAPFVTKRFSENTLDIIDSIPEIDLVLMSHDHYDHLDLDSIQLLKHKTNHFFTALGVGRHLESWGIASSDITEFDWWENAAFGDIKITFTPTRHFSGRGLRDRARSLWGGWAFRTASSNVYFSGDGGYGDHFRQIGAELGPFNMGFMECGQYNEHWHQIHMYPEESVQAAIDAGVGRAMPVHWSGFALSLHHWKEPANRFVAAADQKTIPIVLPKLGQVFSHNDDQAERWWDAFV